jgi:predicted PurR-regulated permease PerM
VTPGARARRALLVDVVAAVLIAALVLSLTAGLGVVAFFALPLLLLGLLWIAVERLVVRFRRRRRPAG